MAMHPLVASIAASWPQVRWQDVTVLVAVSGGPDSVALLRALAELAKEGSGRLIVAHYNHRLRGADSDGDQAFVEQLGTELKLEVIVGTADSGANAASANANEPGQAGDARRHSLPTAEAATREARYQFLKRAAHESGARYVATAHTADDQVETVLHHIVRGTGLSGLAGISPVRRLSEAAALVRPLLTVSRCVVIDYLNSLHQTYREDATNREQNYTRNRIRHALLPELEAEYNPRVRDALLRLAQIAGQADDYLTQQARALLPAVSERIPGGVSLQLPPLAAAHPALIRQCLLEIWREQAWPQQAMSMEKWSDLVEVIRSTGAVRETPVQTLPGNIRAERTSSRLKLTRD